MKLSIVIPVYNERKYICEVIDRVVKADTGHVAKEIIVVDDHSPDGTREILKNEIVPVCEIDDFPPNPPLLKAEYYNP